MFSCKVVSKFQKRDMFLRSKVELGLPPYTSTIDILTHAHLDSIVWLNSLWIRDLTLQYMYCKYALCFRPTYELHISFSGRKRKGIISLLPWRGSTDTTYIERLESVIQWNLWVLFWKFIKTLEQWSSKELET